MNANSELRPTIVVSCDCPLAIYFLDSTGLTIPKIVEIYGRILTTFAQHVRMQAQVNEREK